jgi:hypothetical protein
VIEPRGFLSLHVSKSEKVGSGVVLAGESTMGCVVVVMEGIGLELWWIGRAFVVFSARKELDFETPARGRSRTGVSFG